MEQPHQRTASFLCVGRHSKFSLRRRRSVGNTTLGIPVSGSLNETREVKIAQPPVRKDRGFLFLIQNHGSVTNGTAFATVRAVVQVKEVAMQRHYSNKRLTEREWMEIEEILLDELEYQCWYGVTFLNWFGEETLVMLQ